MKNFVEFGCMPQLYIKSKPTAKRLVVGGFYQAKSRVSRPGKCRSTVKCFFWEVSTWPNPAYCAHSKARVED